MKPVNLDNSPCSPISSNCVIWNGPDIPCIKLCKGDTVSTVVFNLATELCGILDTLDVSGYDLSCFNLNECAPKDFQELIQFILDKLCAALGLNPDGNVGTGDTVTISGDFTVSAASCFNINEPIKISEYVNVIGTRVCQLVNEINIINQTISQLNSRVTALENEPDYVYTLPSFFTACPLGSLAEDDNPIDDILEAFINEVWCGFYATTDTTANLASAIASQTVAINDISIQFPGTQMSIAYAAFNTAGTLAEAIENLWIVLEDTRTREYTVVAGNNTTVTPVVAGGLTTFTIDGETADVQAGDNISVSSAGPVAGVTTFTVSGKDTIVQAGTGIQVAAAGPVAGVTTYTVSKASEDKSYNVVVSTVDLTLSGTPTLYHFPAGYNTLTHTNTTGITQTYEVHVSFDSGVTLTNEALVDNWIDGAIIKTVLGVDSTIHESISGQALLDVSLFDGAAVGDVINIASAPDTVVTTPGANPVETRFVSAKLINNSSFFAVVNLNDGESVSLKFKTDASANNALLNRAQLLVKPY
jgi:hypothetical protein